MENLINQLKAVGLTDEEAKNSVEIVYKWVEENYPILAMLAKTTIQEEKQKSGAEEFEEEIPD
jgi:hypothetical protein